MKCKVVLNYGDNAIERYECFGELKFENGGFSLDYDFNGDTCRLSYDGKILIQNRRGKMRIDLTFAEGKQTVCFTEDTALGYNCLLNVKTYGINYVKTESGLMLNLDYTVEDVRTVLNLTAETGKEKK